MTAGRRPLALAAALLVAAPCCWAAPAAELPTVSLAETLRAEPPERRLLTTVPEEERAAPR
jgi:hypothetical protein